MTGIDRSGQSHGEAAPANSARGSSSLVPGEGSQFFDAALERMHSGRQDRATPHASHPPSSAVAAPRIGEIKAAKRKIGRLLENFDVSRNAAMQAQSPEQAQELIDQVVGAGSEVLDYYASLRPDLARRILPDDQARRLRDGTLDAGNQCNVVATPIIYGFEKSRKKAAEVLEDTRKSNAPSHQLSRVVAGVSKHYIDCMEWWGKKALRSERMQSVCAATADLPSASPEMRQAEESTLRLHTGWALYTKCMYLQSRIALAQVLIGPLASTFQPAVREALVGEDGRVRLLGTFIEDVFPAFLSASDAVLNGGGRPLDAEHCAVLEGVMERLSEFALGVHGIVVGLKDAGTAGDLPLELLDQIVEGAWVTAHEVMRLMAVQPKTPAMIEPLAEAAIAQNTAAAEGSAGRRKGKGKRAPAAGEGSSTGRPEPQLAKPDAGRAPTAKVVVLSDLGTKKLASVEEAHAIASSSATAHLAMWQAPPSRKALTGLLSRLDELLEFDLPGQQSAVSQTRQMKPEDADHVVGTVIERLQRQAAESEACVAALEELRRSGLLTPLQVREVHSKIVRLKAMLSEVQGQANALNAQRTAITVDCMKTYAFPSQNYLEQLQAAGELAPPDQPRALNGDPGTLFEIKLQPKALRNRAMPSPMWVHIHTTRPVSAWQLAMLGDADFAACHVKSHEQRGYNRHWQNARAAMGHENVVIHRGKLTPAFCRSLLNNAVGANPWYRSAEAEYASMRFSRLGI
ncbi:hypothetical protein MTX26_27840 [Bradyrhizobium sp. ISRA443]|uniref:hypothetical protein n=1 Tax=unclassified Bradyrhizobium TaxID=2631580 RepID=UPI0024787317|nr:MULTISPECIES: hypothetical protein [unclassified Bradyrhizobium]WGR93520.1 hypothetical protein MTX20_02705 [Bradyrhizobium sp. ISRA435]WGR98071.1 hypothetical protein MTX23_27830 [Bradyrhizobium sp. ISRA436]WGS04960.1 hypothetical protein MTX18_27835 [Bradyrhizobium sp. ISRA437]WGS11844.1 hypothetical protein MTX26_27840 [Bradyrhizobium sp. ISRA443]